MAEGKIHNLQALIEQWGEKFSKQHDTTCKWVDLHAKKSEMKKDFKHFSISVRVNIGSCEGSGAPTASEKPPEVFEETYTNEGSVEQEVVFKHSTTTTDTYTWTVKDALDAGVPLSGPMGVPLAASPSSGFDTTISVDTLQSQTKTDTKEWAIDKTHKVAPHSKLEVSWTVNRQRTSGVFHTDVIISGFAAIMSKDKFADVGNTTRSGENKLWFIPVARVFNEMKEWGIEVPPQYTIINDRCVSFKVSGVFEGESGSYPSGSVTQTSLPAAE